MNAINDVQLKELINSSYELQYQVEQWYKNYKREQQIKQIETRYKENPVIAYTTTTGVIGIILVIVIIIINWIRKLISK